MGTRIQNYIDHIYKIIHRHTHESHTELKLLNHADGINLKDLRKFSGIAWWF